MRLEPRALLSAPVATVQSFAVTADTMTLVVRYDADTDINTSTIDPTDAGVTGPSGVSRLAESATITSHQTGSAVVAYVIRRANAGTDHDLWPIGNYNLGIAAGAVHSTDGAGNAETGGGSYYIWFPDTYVELRSTGLNGDGWAFDVTRWMRSPDSQNSVTTTVRVSGPGGDQDFQTSGIYSTHAANLSIHAENSDGLWDFSDTGAYSVSVATYTGQQATGFQPAAQYYLWFTNPKIEITGTSFTATTVLITARFTDDHGIDASSIDWSAIGIDVGPYHIPPTIDLYHTVVPQQDGSVIATFRRGWYQSYWTSRDNGDWTYRTNAGTARVQDVDGNSASVGVIMHQQHTFTVPFVQAAAVHASPDDPTTLSVNFILNPRGIDMTTLGDGDLRLELGGQTYQLSLTSISNGGTDAYGQPLDSVTFAIAARPRRPPPHRTGRHLPEPRCAHDRRPAQYRSRAGQLVGGFQLARCKWRSAARENPLRLVHPDPVLEIADQVEHRRGDDQQAVEAVQESAVPRDHNAEVLDPQVPLDRAQHQVPELAADGNRQPQQHQWHRMIDVCPHEDMVREKRHQQRREHHRPDAPTPGLLRAGVRCELAMAGEFAADVREDVVELDRGEDHEQDGPVEVVVGEVPQVPEA